MGSRYLLICSIFIAALGVACAARRGDTRVGLGGIDPRIELVWLEKAQSGQGFIHGPGSYGRTFQLDGLERFYEIHVPPGYTGKEAVPLVMVLHGGGGYPAAVRYQSHMDKVSDRHGFMVVFPGGHPASKLFKDRLLVWNDGRKNKDGSANTVDDVLFIRTLIDDVGALFHIDADRVYAAGISNGAQFSYVLAQKIPDKLAAIGCVAGQRAPDTIFLPPDRPIPVVQFAGKKDEIGPYDGGTPDPKGGFKVGFETELQPVPVVCEAWRHHNGCPEKPKKTERIGNAVLTLYGPGKKGAEVALWTLEDGGHTWPGGETTPSERRAGVGPINTDIDGSEEMWKFFQRHQRK